MDKFFNYVLLAFFCIFMAAVVVAFVAAFLVNSFLGLGDPAPAICLATSAGCLYNAAVCWVLRKVLKHLANE